MLWEQFSAWSLHFKYVSIWWTSILQNPALSPYNRVINKNIRTYHCGELSCILTFLVKMCSYSSHEISKVFSQLFTQCLALTQTLVSKIKFTKKKSLKTDRKKVQLVKPFKAIAQFEDEWWVHCLVPPLHAQNLPGLRTVRTHFRSYLKYYFLKQ